MSKVRKKIAIVALITLIAIANYYFLDISVSAGTASDRMILLWDTANGAVPTGWTSVSDVGGLICN